MVEQVIDKSNLEKGEFFVEPSFDDELAELKETMDGLEEKIGRQLRKASNDLGLDSIKLDYVSHLGHHLRIPLREEAAIRKNKDYKVLDTIKGGARFTTERMSELNDEFQRTKQMYEDQQQSIVAEIVRVSSRFRTKTLYDWSFVKLDD